MYNGGYPMSDNPSLGPLVALSDHAAALVEWVAGATVAVRAGRAWSSVMWWC